MASQKRIAKELNECMSSPPEGMTVELADDEDVHKWHVTLAGPPGSVYSEGKFGVVVSLPSEYPFKPPTVTFATRIYHPNVTNDTLGNICLAALKPEAWKPATKLRAVLEAVRSLLVEPQPDDPLEGRIADEYRNDRGEFEKNVRAYIQRYAKGAAKFDAAPPTAAAGAPGNSNE
ncbi:ubiquitin-conjugating enzyme [Lasiosphaeria miniovina]|uniref:E2 ubiquitin-conjugating enzyme n=1 Tax=Lasiosphaeria miniovina TaxID=1954250 RepID=A0AA40ATC0_9PEZI|nr:ubiquitin-conjugating enzyme [Lasiosphaeria miniovina]KAK0721648.1 ubiquitin-conjugating enzyme [Lasiosphaeria miniovina]